MQYQRSTARVIGLVCLTLSLVSCSTVVKTYSSNNTKGNVNYSYSSKNEGDDSPEIQVGAEETIKLNYGVTATKGDVVLAVVNDSAKQVPWQLQITQSEAKQVDVQAPVGGTYVVRTQPHNFSGKITLSWIIER